jgi:hypothetical protein
MMDSLDKAIRICDKQTRVIKNDGSFAMIYPWKVQVMSAFGWSNAGAYKTKEEAEAAAKKM